MSEYDPFKLDTGLLDDVDFKVNDAWWEFNDYNNGDTLVLVLKVLTDDDDQGEQDVWFPVGGGAQDWVTKDNGQTAERADGKRKNFNNRSAVGMLVGSLMTVGAEEVLRKRYQAEGLTPQSAGLFKGLHFHVNRTEVDFGSDIGKKDRLVATEFFGEVGTKATGGTAKKATGTTAKATKAVAKKATAGAATSAASTNAFGITDAVYERLHEIAAPLETHDQFMEQVFAELTDEITADETLITVVSDGETGSLWDEAVQRAMA